MKTFSFSQILPLIRRALWRVCCVLLIVTSILPSQPSLARPLFTVQINSTTTETWNDGGTASMSYQCAVHGETIYCTGTATMHDTSTILSPSIRLVVNFTATSDLYVSYYVSGSTGTKYSPIGQHASAVATPGQGNVMWPRNYGSNAGSGRFLGISPGPVGDSTVEFSFSASTTGYVNPIYQAPPASGDCSDGYDDTHYIADMNDINPTIEFPHGPSVEPPDEQKVSLTGAEIYHLSITGQWNGNRSDYAYSFNGTSWSSLSLLPVICASNNDYYFKTSEQYFYIRANDTAGAFANNTPSTAPFPTWSLAEATPKGTGCSQYYRDAEYFANNQPIDPKIETPQGVNGTPPDTQIAQMDFSTVATGFSPTLHLSVSGTWQDGETTTEQTSYQYSFDRLSWYSFSVGADSYQSDTETEMARCTDANGIWIKAPADANFFYIRVADTSENFANNLPDAPENFPLFTLLWAEQIAPVSCSDQFQYDEQDDWLISSYIYGNAAEPTIPENITLTIGDWYVLETAGPHWVDGNQKDRYDIKASQSEVEGRMTANGATEMSVWKYTRCSEFTDETKTHKRYFFQSPANTIRLWVNSPSDQRPNNSGRIGYNLYHVPADQYTYFPSACEREFSSPTKISSLNIPAISSLGLPLPYPDLTVQNPDYRFEQGQYYMLETVGGPWLGRNNGEAEGSFKLQVKVNEQNESFEPLESWSKAYCIVPVDKLGHLRVYFQEPVGTVAAGDARYYVRVNDGNNPGNYTNNSGWMGLLAYRQTKISQVVPSDENLAENACKGLYYKTGQLSSIPVNPKLSNGVTVPGMLDGEYYAIETQNYWSEGDSSNQHLFEISVNDGVTWQFSSSDVLCSELGDTEGSARFYIKKSPGMVFKIRADDQDGTWGNNVDHNFGVTLSTAHLIYDPFNTCANNYELSLISSVFDADVFIPAQEEPGIPLATVADKVYALRIYAGKYQDPSSSSTEYYTGQVSMDARSTFRDFNDASIPGYLCYAKAGNYETVYFTASSQLSAVRVKDHDNNFSNNSGGLYYQLYAVTAATDQNGFPVDPGGFTPGQTIMSCYRQPVRPYFTTGTFPTWTGTDISALGEWLYSVLNYGAKFATSVSAYTSASIGYWSSSAINFFLWCPEHTAALKAIMVDIQTNHEPFAIISRYLKLQKEVSVQIGSYDWEYANSPIIPFSEGGGPDGENTDSLLPSIENTPFGGQPFEWKPLPEGGGPGGCQAHLVARWGETNPLTIGFCSIMELLLLTKANYYFNVAIIFAAIVIFVRYLRKKWVETIVYMILGGGTISQ